MAIAHVGFMGVTVKVDQLMSFWSMGGQRWLGGCRCVGVCGGSQGDGVAAEERER